MSSRNEGDEGKKPEIENPFEHWKKDFKDAPTNNDIDKILEFPPISDMAGVMARANFKNDRQRMGAVLLAKRNRKFHDNDNQEMLRDMCASTLGMGGLGKVMQTFATTKLLAADMFRAALGMPRTKRPEEVHHSSDLRTEGREKEQEDRGV